LTGLKSAICRIQDGIRLRAVKEEERKVGGSSGKVLMPFSTI
jgi:hypothetical protein